MHSGFLFPFILDHHYPAQLVRGFTLSDLLDKLWSQVGVFPSPPGFTLSDLLDKLWSQVGVFPSPPVRTFIFIVHRVQHSHFSAIFF